MTTYKNTKTNLESIRNKVGEMLALIDENAEDDIRDEFLEIKNDFLLELGIEVGIKGSKEEQIKETELKIEQKTLKAKDLKGLALQAKKAGDTQKALKNLKRAKMYEAEVERLIKFKS